MSKGCYALCFVSSDGASKVRNCRIEGREEVLVGFERGWWEEVVL